MFKFVNKADVIDIYVYGEINSDSFWDDSFSSSMLREKLDEANGKPVNIYINSGGGDVFEGQAISAILERYEGQKTCYIDGICASIATKIPFACDKVYFAKGAYFMIHKAWSLAIGNSDDLLEMANTLEQIDNGLVATYKANSKMEEDVIRAKMKAETWYTSDDINNDFDFEVIEGKKVAACVTEEQIKNFINAPKFEKNSDEKLNRLKIELELL